ncbi:TaqI family restriction endonuclease [Patescibacteria group bacterium]|nr:TaqI family restriction endonuclease [Candidatus Falkowbacteria bacterium]MBU3906410.1 TaqI family restriction endonuclease [Patescibacteria group bacterium]MCG2698183.1 TaqI family restriction endonuclease [Candidatus Parcubacteria bacterium]MBU4014883.1 TaqI family restriction endonuclease [Patescibacteria group bacterium]MBU4026840.1 TaqI family restriction endonuclease [Patescibacteria group bacterium]
MILVEKFEKFLKLVDLVGYRERYRPIKLVEMDLPKDIQAIEMLYKVYWDNKKFLNYDDFYKEYLNVYKENIESFRIKITMCKNCFYRGLPARIYRTWASIITQIHAGYVAESVFGENTVDMSAELDHKGADFQVKYRGRVLNYQVKKKSFSREVRQEKKTSNPIVGEFIDIKYEVPSEDYFKNPKKKNGEYKLPYSRFIKNKELKRFLNGFVVFTPMTFEAKKKEIDKSLK